MAPRDERQWHTSVSLCTSVNPSSTTPPKALNAAASSAIYFPMVCFASMEMICTARSDDGVKEKEFDCIVIFSGE